MAFRLFRQVLPMSRATEGRRVLIYGAGDGGELLLRELQNNRALKYAPIGFVDDDPAKYGKVIHGLRVFGGNGDLKSICGQHHIDEILISSSRMTDEKLQEILDLCRDSEIGVKRMRISIEDLSQF
jgi:UDP-GlcNAc:undecaprenyl-phosphate GlcNAc-1-phosphate transferase